MEQIKTAKKKEIKKGKKTQFNGNRTVGGLIPGLCSLHVEVSLGNIVNAKPPTVCVCVCVCVCVYVCINE